MAVKVASKLTLLLTDLVEHHSAEGKKSFLPTVWAALRNGAQSCLFCYQGGC